MTALANVAAANSSSISIRARSPHPPASPEPLQDAKDANSKESIELAEIGQNAGASIRAASNTAGSSSETTPTTRIDRRKLNIHFAAMCFSLFLAGWNDGTTGPLLPRIQKVYHVGFVVVSLIFVFNCLGFITAAAANVALTDRFGLGKVMVLGSLCQMIGYALASPAPPFEVFVLGYAINGFGLALQDAGANGYVSGFEHGASTKMSIMHAVYGFGALFSPLVATQFSERTHWSYHYLISLSIAFLDTVILIVVLRFRDQDECLAELGQAKPEKTVSNEEGKYRQIFRLRALHLLAVFIFIYVGVEVTIGGWIVTYVIDVRSGGPSSGYISSGFFGGLMLGRVALLWVNKTIGERYVIYLYVLLAVGLELIVWLVPSLIGGAVAVSFVGLLLGPVYPIVMNHSSRILPPWLLTGCIGWIAGFGQAGSAFLPFITGLLASREGIKSLQPLLVSMMGFMVILWAVVPNHARRVD